jgi:hypothetical protein
VGIHLFRLLVKIWKSSCGCHTDNYAYREAVRFAIASLLLVVATRCIHDCAHVVTRKCCPKVDMLWWELREVIYSNC